MNKTKRRILETALQCFMEKGVEQSTIADIRKASGISVGSIYHHFGNKDGIVAALFATGMKDHAEKQQTSLTGCQSAEQGVKSIVLCYIDWILQHPDWARFIFRYRGLVENGPYAETHSHLNREHLHFLKAWFAPHVQDGSIQALPIEVYHALIIGPAQDFALKWLAGKTRSEFAEHRTLFAEAGWRSVSRINS